MRLFRHSNATYIERSTPYKEWRQELRFCDTEKDTLAFDRNLMQGCPYLNAKVSYRNFQK